MLPIPEYVKELLFEQDCVVISDFGGFIANFISAGFHEPAGVYLPPRKRVAFNEALHFDDGLLSSYISFREQISRNEAVEYIKKFVSETRQSLRQNQSISFAHLGIFTLNSEGKLQFEPFSEINYYGEGYGLASIFLNRHQETIFEIPSIPETIAVPPAEVILEPETEVIENQTEAIETVEHEEENSQPLYRPNRWWLAAALTLIIGAGAVWMWLSSQNSTDSSLSSLNPFAFLFNKTSSEKITWPIDQNPQPYADSVVKAWLRTDAPNKLLFQSAAISTTLPATELPITTEQTPVAQTSDVQPVKLETIENEIKQPETRYYVIGGAFGSRRNAMKLKRFLQTNGYHDVTIIYPNAGDYYIKVSAADYKSASAAYAKTEEISELTGESAWVMKHRGQ